MTLVLCADDRGGLSYNHRRQSRDREVSARVLADAAGRPLWCAPSSLALFGPGAEGHLTAAEDFLNRAGPGELCFVEGRPLLPWLERMEGLVLYRWNRRYPADVYLDISLQRFDTVFPAAGSANSAVELTCDQLAQCAQNFRGWGDFCKGWQENP